MGNLVFHRESRAVKKNKSMKVYGSRGGDLSCNRIFGLQYTTEENAYFARSTLTIYSPLECAKEQRKYRNCTPDSRRQLTVSKLHMAIYVRLIQYLLV